MSTARVTLDFDVDADTIDIPTALEEALEEYFSKAGIRIEDARLEIDCKKVESFPKEFGR